MKKAIKWIVRIAGSFIVTLIVISLLILLPPVQLWLTNTATKYLKDNYAINSTVGSIRIAFPNNIVLDNFLLQDNVHDTIAFVGEIKVQASLIKLLAKKIQVNDIEISDVNVKVLRAQDDTLFNIDPILQAINKKDADKNKTSSKSNWHVYPGNIHLENWSIDFRDESLKSHIHFDIGDLAMKFKAFDLSTRMVDILFVNVADSHGFFSSHPEAQKYQNPAKDTPRNDSLQDNGITLNVTGIQLDNISFELALIQELYLKTAIKTADLENLSFDMSRLKLELDNFNADGAFGQLNISETKTTDSTGNYTMQQAFLTDSIIAHPFGNNMDFTIRNFNLANSEYHMKLDDLDRRRDGLDYLNYDITDINIQVTDIHVDEDSISTSVHHLACKELGGLTIDSLKGNFSINDKFILADAFQINTPKSHIGGSAKMGYPSLEAIGEELGMLTFDVSISPSDIYLRDIRLSAPSVFNHWPMDWEQTIQFKDGLVTGPLADLDVGAVNLEYGHSALNFSGTVKGLPDIDRMNFDLNLDTLLLKTSDLRRLLDDSAISDSLHLPKYLTAGAHIQGVLADFNSEIKINSDKGSIHNTAAISIVDQNVGMDGLMDLSGIDISPFIGATQPQEVDMQTKYVFKRSENVIQSAIIGAKIEKLEFNNYPYRNIKIEGAYQEENVNLNLDIDDPHLVAGLQINGLLKNSLSNLSGIVSINKAHLDTLNLFSKPVEFKTNSQFDIVYTDSSNFNIDYVTDNMQLRKADIVHDIELFNFKIVNAAESGTNFQLTSTVMDAFFIGNVQYYSLPEIINDHVTLYMSEDDTASIYDDKYFGFGLEVHRPDIITEIFADQSKSIEIGRCRGSFDGSERSLQVDIIVPTLSYNNLEIDSARLYINSSKKDFNSTIHLQRFGYDTIFTHDIVLSSLFQQDHLISNFEVLDHNDERIHHLTTHVNYSDSIYYLKLDPENLMLNCQKWSIPEENLLSIHENIFNAQKFFLSNQEEEIRITSVSDQLRLDLQELDISNFLSILDNRDIQDFAQGHLDGNMMLIRKNDKINLISELSSTDFKIQNQELEQLKFNLSSYADSISEIALYLNSKNNTLNFDAINLPSTDETSVKIVTDLRDLSFFSLLLPEFIQSPSGQIHGKLDINVKEGTPMIDGNLNFINTTLLFEPMNTLLTLKDESIAFNKNVLTVKSFTILDSMKNELVVNGTVSSSDYNNFKFNLDMKSQKFNWINSQPSKDKVVFGDLYTSLDLHLTGSNTAPKIDSDIVIQDQTDITIVLPGKELEMISDEGIVYFSKTDLSRDSLLQKGQEFIADSIARTFKGLKLTTRLKVRENAQFNVIIDPNSGDYAEFNILGNLLYSYDPVSQGRLNGIIEFKKEGFYELSFYGLVKKRFLFGEGSSVSWSNRVMDGNLNFTAMHIVTTNSTGLVSDEVSDYEKSRYNQRLPYEVLLHITGTVANPEINFSIDLPERIRSDNPTIDAKLASLNQQEMEAERNKQVFALLVAGTFIPESSGGSGGNSGNNFATTAARNSVNSILTQQLNNLTSQIIKGVDVNFGMNTFEDYRSGTSEVRTQLDVQVSKNLFNDRLALEMESHIDLDANVPQVGQTKTDGMMEFAVSYKLTENGNFRIKGFRENAFDIYDGEIQNAGIAFIFIKDFDVKQRKQYHAP